MGQHQSVDSRNEAHGLVAAGCLCSDDLAAEPAEGSMTESEWLACTDPSRMLKFLWGAEKGIDRKLRLFITACARSLHAVFGDEQEAVAVYERHADGLASEEDLIRLLTGDMFDWFSPDGTIPPGHKLQPVWEAAIIAAKTATDFTHLDTRDNTDEENAGICNMLRDIVGNPFRPLPPIDPAVLAWNDGCVVKLATCICEEREFTQERIGVLADALEEAGVTDEEVLSHLRDPGPHARGCWALDLLTGR